MPSKVNPKFAEIERTERGLGGRGIVFQLALWRMALFCLAKVCAEKKVPICAPEGKGSSTALKGGKLYERADQTRVQ